MKILVTGGAGYIGSITNWFLRRQGHDTVVFDNLLYGHRQAVGETKLVVGDLRNPADLSRVFAKAHFDAVIHFAAFTKPSESMEKPYEYFHNNVDGGLNLLEAMRQNDCGTIIFSSTCAVYGYPKRLPVTEEMPMAPVSAYGASKHMFEELMVWYGKIYGTKGALLRYFNACGALEDGTLGEDHRPETHIIPVALAVANGERPAFNLFGRDYDTPDGTCIRDYIHVLDLAEAHVKAVEYLNKSKGPLVVNLGVGKGYSNLEVIKAVEKVTGKGVKVIDKPRRWGDPDSIFADNKKAKQLLEWQPRYTAIEPIIETDWKWHRAHPRGYGA